MSASATTLPTNSLTENYEERLELRLWPLSEKNRCVQVVNPYFLSKKDYPSGEIPTRIIGYMDETKDSLELVRDQAFNELDTIKERVINKMNSRHEDNAINCLFYTGGCDLGCFLLPSFLTSNLQVILSVGTVAAGLVTAVSARSWIKGRREFKSKIKNINENIKRFETSPVEKFETVKDEEIEDIYNAIKNNEPLKIEKPINVDYHDAISKMIREIGGHVSPFPEVYQQKLATYA